MVLSIYVQLGTTRFSRAGYGIFDLPARGKKEEEEREEEGSERDKSEKGHGESSRSFFSTRRAPWLST